MTGMTEFKLSKTAICVADVTLLSDPELYRAAEIAVSEKRREKALRFRFEKDRQRSLGVELLLRRMLREAGFSGPFPEITEGPLGKPVFKDLPDVCFSLSHAGDYAACALSDVPVGLDIETFDHASLRVAEHFFTEREQADIAACPTDGEKAKRFIRYWTLKESYVKMTGEGLRVSPKAIGIRLGETVEMFRNGCRENVFFEESDTVSGLHLAVCTAEKRPLALRITDLWETVYYST